MGYPSLGDTPEDSQNSTVDTPDVKQQQDDAEYAEFLAFKRSKARAGREPEDAIPAGYPTPTPVTDVKHTADVSRELGELQTLASAPVVDDPSVKASLPQDMVTISAVDLQRIQKRIDDLEADVKNQRIVATSQDAIEGGAPVPHHLHLSDGTVMLNHGGLATHIATAEGKVLKVVNAFRADESN